MKTISDKHKELIEEALFEQALRLSPAMFEKDLMVTEALRAISQVGLPGVTLTFSGGTCLSKAYGLLERMSEDIDLRLVVDNQELLTRSALTRTLRALKHSLTERLRVTDFGLEDKDILARNEYRFLAFNLRYTPRFPTDQVLRHELRIEFMAIAPRCATEIRTIRPLLDEVIKRETVEPVKIACLALEETYCEKIISYLRRSGEFLAAKEHSQYDERLARHVYDVHRIATLYYRHAEVSQPCGLFKTILAAEVEQYGRRDEVFRADPVVALKTTLEATRSNPVLRKHYEQFATQLLYGDDRPSFEQAFSTFESSAVSLLHH